MTLYEKEESCGGHTLTDRTSPYPVDLGFQVRPDHTPRLMGCNQAGLVLQSCMPSRSRGIASNCKKWPVVLHSGRATPPRA